MEETRVDRQGNTITKPSDTGIPCKARLQVQGQSGTSSRRQEQDNEGFESEKVYRMSVPRAWTAQHGVIGAQAEIEWDGNKWAVFGDASFYSGSPRTAHVDYTIKRY